MTRPDEVPTLTLPREDMMRIAMAFRTTASVLRYLREKDGRSAFSDAEHVARREEIARANGIRPMTRAETDEWRRADEAGSVATERHASGMTVQTTRLDDDRFGLKARMGDTHVDTVVGSQAMLDDLSEWLRNNSTESAIAELHVAAEDLQSTSGSRSGTPYDRAFDSAYAWMNQPEQAEIRALWDDRGNDLWHNNENRDFDRSARAGWLIEQWKKAMGTEAQWDVDTSAQTPHADDPRVAEPAADRLSDRLRGRVADAILDHPRWQVADDQFAKLVGQGADPDLLADVVAGIRFHDGIRSPSGFAAWTMRDAVKQGGAQPPGEQKTEDQVKREVAEEWLADSDPISPLDRARAAQLVGEIDDQFDARLADRYPGLLDGDRLRDRANARADQHDANARVAEDTAARHEAAAREFVGGDQEPTQDAEPNGIWDGLDDQVDRAEAASSGEYDRAYAADERNQARQERITAETEAVQPTEAAQRAARPLQRPANVPQPPKAAPSKLKPAPRTQDRVNRRSL